MKVRRTHTAVEYLSGQRHSLNQRGKLVLRRQGKKGIGKRDGGTGWTTANGVQRRGVDRCCDISRRWPRKKDAVTSTQDQRVGIRRRVGKTETRSKIIWIDARQETLAHVRHSRQVISGNH